MPYHGSADALARRAEARRAVMPTEYPVAGISPGDTHYVVAPESPIDYYGGDSTLAVYVDGRAVSPGRQTTRALALLGIADGDLDARWRQIVAEENEEYQRVAIASTYAFDHQEDMGWRVDVRLEREPGLPAEVNDLAYVDATVAHRTATYQVRRWEPGEFQTGDPPLGTTSRVVTRSEDLPPSSAFGGIFSGVSDDEVTETTSACDALAAAGKELAAASDEMEIAIRVASSSWQGERAAATIAKLRDDQAVVDQLTQVVDGWKETLDVVVDEQHDAQDKDVQLQKEIEAEVAITIVAGVVTFGAGAIATQAAFVGRLAWWARKLHDIRQAVRARVATRSQRARTAFDRLDRLRRSSAATHAAHAAGRAAGEVSASAAVKWWSGQPVTEDWQKNALLAFTGYSLGAGVAHQFHKRLGFREDSSAVAAAVPAGVAQATIAEYVKGDDETGSFVAGLPGGVAEAVTFGGLRRSLATELRNDDALNLEAARRAQQRVAQGTYESRAERVAAFKGLKAEELDKLADETAAPIAEFFFGAAASQAGNLAGNMMEDGPKSPDVRAPAGAGRPPIA